MRMLAQTKIRKVLTLDQVLQRLRDRVEEAGSLEAAAERMGTTKSLLSETLNRKRSPGPTVLRALGIHSDKSYWIEEKQ